MLGVFLKEEIFQLTNTSRSGTFCTTDFFLFFSTFACDKMKMKHRSLDVFLVICMDLGQLELMKYCDRGRGENIIKNLLRDI